ncbi:MAG: glycosyltransferase [Gammaproteobacteria bacterium]|nr:glycosyltransferase [Gammaproteobacteria bacterium]
MLTVLLATYNGSLTLERSLQKFIELDEPKGGYNLIVVDNASTDSTPKILKEFENKLPLNWLRIERQGKNLALNAGLELVTGDLVVLTDDDILPQKDWLVRHREFANKNPAVDMWGGSIVPHWPFTPSTWILDQVPLGAVYALTDPQLITGPIKPDLVWGANMAVRAEVFRAGHRFNEHIGPAAGEYTMGSEVEFTCRIAQAGYRSWYLREAVVEHIIRPNQVDRNWIVKRAYRFGKSKHAKNKQDVDYQKNMIKGVPRWKYGALLFCALQSIYYRITGNQAARFKADWDKQYHLGYIVSAWKKR